MPTINIASPGVSETDLRSAIVNLSARPNIRRMVCLGDSRIASMFTDPVVIQRYKSSGSQINWALALSGRRVAHAINLGVSGDRTDQINARLSSALTFGAGIGYYIGGVNDIASNYPSASTSGATSAANKIAAAETMIAAGMEVILETEIGAENLTSTQIGQMLIHNQTIRDYARTRAHLHLHDAAIVVTDMKSSATAIAFKTGHSYDGTHLSPRGAYWWGKSLASILNILVPPAFIGVSRFETPSMGRMQYLANPTFQGTGGTIGTGITGSMPASMGARRGGSATATVAIVADADGNSNNLAIDMTFTAADEFIDIYSDAQSADWSVGDIFQGFARVTVTTPGVLYNAALLIQNNKNGGGSDSTQDHTDLFTGSALVSGVLKNYGPDETYEAWLATDPYEIPALISTKGWFSGIVRFKSTGAGTASVVVKDLFVRRKLAM